MCWGVPRGEESETLAPGHICWAPPDLQFHPVMFPGLSMFLVTSVSELAGLNESVKLGHPLPGFSFFCVPLGFDHFAVSVLEGTLQGGSFQRWPWAGTKVRWAGSALCWGVGSGLRVARIQEALLWTLPVKPEPRVGGAHPSASVPTSAEWAQEELPVSSKWWPKGGRGCQDAWECVTLNFRSGLLFFSC